ncbi:MAG: hypothetical protein F6K47_06540 [Symploca sp. SIO2E6]|nr:hypothetical protein [Symploca sp. SIO2E6]
MKCIQCGTDNNLKERLANYGRCKNCHHKFAFEPTVMATRNRFTDPFFAKLLNDISANNTLYFTPTQLFYLLEKRLAKKNLKMTAGWIMGWGVMLIVFGFLFLVTILGLPLMMLGVVVLLYSLWYSQSQLQSQRALLIDQSMTQEWLERWNQANSTPEKLLSQDHQQSTPISIASDITAYSFDRLLVCDSTQIAKMLIANNFHFNNNCAVLSITGYPQSIFATAMEMLRNNPDLRVYGLHDCSPDGMELMRKLQTDANWFAQSNVVIIDVGLLPRQIMAAKRNMSVQVSEASATEAKLLPKEIRQNLGPKELEWLESGNFVELESFTPLRLMQILNRSMAKGREIDSDDGEVILIDDSDSDSDRNYYVIDSFG